MEKNVVFRSATEGDVGFLTDCAHCSYVGYVERIGQEPAPMIADFASHLKTDHVEIIESSGVAIGYAVWNDIENELFLENIAIMPEHQGGGLGGSAMKYLEDKAKQLGLSAISLYTNQKMTENLEFYARLGFQEVDRRREDGFDRVYFRKPIGNV